MYIHSLQIGNVKLENNILLAPMAGITDLPFRIIAREYGAGLAFTEMASAKAIFYGDEKTKRLLYTKGEKSPLAVQIFGSDIQSMSYAAKEMSESFDLVDINMGCPAPKVVKNGDGSKLLQNLDLVGQIVEEVVKASKVPVSVKIRKGWGKNDDVAVEAAKIIEKAGANLITIHGRTREEFFSGDVDLEVIKRVKNAVSIQVIGNGNITDEESALKMFEYTGVDGIMIGRASIGNPWIFKKITHYLQTGEKIEISENQKLETIIKHIELEVEEKGERVGIPELRKHLACYIKSIPNASKTREKINSINTKDELIEFVKECF
jgi:tRNA-dihydrouridine synthase B